MDVIKVEGGAKLHGTVHVEGAKNSALKLMAATVMAPGVYHLSNVPDISDVRLMCKVLQTLGACVVHGEHELIIDTKTVSNWVTPYEYVSARLLWPCPAAATSVPALSTNICLVWRHLA